MSFVISKIETGKLNALVKNIMKQTNVSDPIEAVRLVNSGECVLSKAGLGSEGSDPKWQIHEDGTITLQVTSDGTTGPQWIVRLEKKGYRVSDYAKQLFNSESFQPTSGACYQVTILPGKLFLDNERVTRTIRADATKRGLIAPSAEVACLLRVHFSDVEIKELGLWWLVVMHEPIKDSDGFPSLFSLPRGSDGRWLYTYWGGSGHRWSRVSGFVFVSSAS